MRRSRLFVVLGLRSPFPCRLSAESHAQLLKVTHTPGYLAHLSPTALTMQQVPLQLSARAFPPVWPAGENALILKAWWERGRGGQMRPTGVLSLLSPNVTSSQAPSTLRAVAVCKQHWGRFRSHAHRPALAT